MEVANIAEQHPNHSRMKMYHKNSKVSHGNYMDGMHIDNLNAVLYLWQVKCKPTLLSSGIMKAQFEPAA